MPEFKKNPSSFMKYSKKGSAFPFKTDEAKNLLKAVPNKEAYNKLSNQDKKGFDKAAKEAGLPTKKAPITKKTGKRTVEKLPEGGKRVRVTDKEGRVKKEVIKGKGYRGVTKFDKQGREVVSKSRSGSMLNPERKSKIKTSYQDDFSNKKSEVKLTTKERGKKKKVIKAKYKKDNRDFFPG